jgi:hypothetical protein
MSPFFQACSASPSPRRERRPPPGGDGLAKGPLPDIQRQGEVERGRSLSSLFLDG